MLYALESALFAFALFASIAVIWANMQHYRAQILAALSNLTLDGVHAPRQRASRRLVNPVQGRTHLQPVR